MKPQFDPILALPFFAFAAISSTLSYGLSRIFPELSNPWILNAIAIVIFLALSSGFVLACVVIWELARREGQEIISLYSQLDEPAVNRVRATKTDTDEHGGPVWARDNGNRNTIRMRKEQP